MVRIEVHDTESGSDGPYLVDVPESVTGIIPMWRDQDQAHLSPLQDPGLWKTEVVEVVQLDLSARMTAVLLIDGSIQRFVMPESVRRKLHAGGSELVRRRIVLDIWSSHVLGSLQIAPNWNVWKLQQNLREARTDQEGATARLQEATENACRLKEMSQGLRHTLVGYLHAEQPPDLARVPQSAIGVLLRGLDMDLESTRNKLTDLQASMDFKRRMNPVQGTGEARQRKAAGAHAEGGVDGEQSDSGEFESDREDDMNFGTPDHSSDEDGETAVITDPAEALEHARQLRDAQHQRLDKLLHAREAVQARATELASSIKNRAKQRLFGMFSRGSPSQLDRLCLSHESLFDALEEAKIARNDDSDHLCELLEICASAEAKVDQAAKSYATEVDKMQQQVIRRDSLTRRDSFTALDGEQDFANNWHKTTMI